MRCSLARAESGVGPKETACCLCQLGAAQPCTHCVLPPVLLLQVRVREIEELYLLYPHEVPVRSTVRLGASERKQATVASPSCAVHVYMCLYEQASLTVLRSLCAGADQRQGRR